MSDWSPWISHDGRGCPCLGQWVQVVNEGDPRIWEGIAGSQGGRSWDWSSAHLFRPVLRYRIRRPKALDLCRRIAALTDQPEPVA